MERFSIRERSLAALVVVTYAAGGIQAAQEGVTAESFARSAKQALGNLGISSCPDSPTAIQLEEVEREVSSALANPESYTPSPAIVQLKNSLATSTNAYEATSAINTYTSTQFSFPTKLTLTPSQVRTKLNSNIYSDNLLMFASYLDTIPVELIRPIGLKNITITNIAEQTQTAIGYNPGSYNSGNGELTIDLNSLADPRVLGHELLGHGLQDAVCDGIVGPDPAFVELNPGADRAYKPFGKTPCLRPLLRPDQFATAYAQTQGPEDSAETTARFLTNQKITKSELLAKNLLGTKTMFVLQRANQLVPNAATQLTHTRQKMAFLAFEFASQNKEPYAKDPAPARTAADDEACRTN